ncbi:MAG: sensor histidine kinase [Armatimonadetes bacterium]|nr:sensor histidine kinase [Armatimonadota bacterium]
MERDARLARLFVYHLWGCVPFALLWLAEPALSLRTESERSPLRAITCVGLACLVARTWAVLRHARRGWWDRLWAITFVVGVSLALACGKPAYESWLALLYFFPIAEAAATLDLAWTLVVSGGAVLGFCLAVHLGDLLERGVVIGLFRLAFLVLFGSLLSQLGRVIARKSAALAVADYRRQLAAEMHDGIQQYLVAIVMRLDLARSLIPTDPAEAAAIATDQAQLARQAADELRVAIKRLNAPLAAEGGPVESLHWYPELFRQRCARAVTLNVVGVPRRLPPKAEHTVLRIVQEATTNVLKHARARCVGIEVGFRRSDVVCRVVDDGVGFDPTAAPEPSVRGGFGLESMTQRAAAVHGRCEVHSVPGRGTTVTVAVPLEAEPRSRAAVLPGVIGLAG